jgi:16S rRNA (guanine966-N2)-methyltransferase
VFVDESRDALKIVRENLSRCKLEGRVMQSDGPGYLERGGKFDIIFLDPPYESGLLEQAMEKIAQFDILSPHGIMVAESPQNQTLPELPAPYGLYREYRYGKIKVSIYHRAVEEEA